ncbi:MAG: hypothetical protein INR65_15235 [Gluconacetobacter diazotrophicus]|nr:hypothetical protein [Gluconacetobacter diazotrophicus]
MSARSRSTPGAMLPALALATVVAAAPGLALAQTDGGAQSYTYKRPSPTTITTFGSLIDLCTVPDSSSDYVADHAVCGGYFSGFIDLYLAETPLAARVICLPDPPITREQARARFMTWAAANPSFTAQPAAVGVYRFLTATYPCAGSSTAGAMPPAPLAKP